MQKFSVKVFKKILILIALSCQINGAHASPASEHPEKPFLSSIPSLFVKPKHFEPHMGSFSLFPERTKKTRFADRNRLNYTYALQSDSSAPMVFLIPGMAGFAFNQPTLYLAEIIYQQGYSVITLPSSTHWSFVLAASNSGRVGYLPDDAKDMYRVMAVVKTEIQRNHQISPRQWGLIGYSYGGLDGAFVLERDLQDKLFNFDFLLMISPPLNRADAIAKVDYYYAYGDRWSLKHRSSLVSFATSRSVEIKTGQRKINTYELLEQAFPLGEPSLAWLLAFEFRRSFLNTAYAGDLIENKGTLTAEDAFKGSITSYLQDSVYKNKINSSENYEQVVKASELSTVMQINAQAFAKKRIILFHSTNDFFSFPDSQNSINQNNFETHLYDYGGHLGFISDQALIEDFKLSLSKLRVY